MLFFFNPTVKRGSQDNCPLHCCEKEYKKKEIFLHFKSNLSNLILSCTNKGIILFFQVLKVKFIL